MAMELFELLGDVPAPWVYRGWLYLFSPRYRGERHQRWKQKGTIYMIADVSFSIVFMLFEVLLLIAAIDVLLRSVMYPQ